VGGLTRRDFLKILGISSVLVGVGGVTYETLKRSEELALEAANKPRIEYKPSRCGMCPQGCSIMTRVVDGRAERIFGNPYGFVFNRGTICARGNMGIYRLYNPDRLMVPLIRSGGERGTWSFTEATWSQAFDEVKNILKEKIDNNEQNKVLFMGGWAACDMLRMPFVAFLMTFGFPNAMNQPMGTCFMPKGMAWTTVVGVGSHEHIMTDFDDVRYLIVLRRNHFGSITVSHASRVGQDLRKFKIVVIDPRLSEEASRADEWIPIRPGTDLAFLLAMMKVIIDEGLYDADYLRKYTNASMLVYSDTLEPVQLEIEQGKTIVDHRAVKDFAVYDEADETVKMWSEAKMPALTGEYDINGRKAIPVLEALKRHLDSKGYTPEWAEKITGIPADTIRRIAIEFGTTRPSAIDTGWHGSKSYNSFQTWRAVAIVNALVGSPLRRGGILLSYGGIEQSLHPMDMKAPPTSDVYQELENMMLTLSDGSSTRGVLFNVGRNYLPMRKLLEKEGGWVFFVVGANPVRTMLDADGWIEKALKSKNMEKIIVYDVLPQDTVLYADIVLPDCAYLERYDRIRVVDFVPYKAFYTAVPAVQPIADCMSFFTFTALMAKELGKGKEFGETLGMLIGLDEEHRKQVGNLVESLDRSILLSKDKRDYFTMKLQEIQADQIASDLGKSKDEVLETLRRKGFMVIGEKEEVIEENMKLLEERKLATPSGMVEIFSFLIWGAIQGKKSGEIKPEWHPLIDWVPPRALMQKPSLGADEFYLTYGKAPTMTHTSAADNPILVRITRKNYRAVWINAERASKLGIKDGDMVEVCNSLGGCFKTRAHVTERIRPDTVFIVNAFGQESPALRFPPTEVVPYNKLVVPEIEPITGSAILGDTYVKIRKI